MAFTQSLRTRLAILLLLAFAPVLALIIYRAYQEQQRRLTEIDASEVRMARQIAAALDLSFARVNESMRLLAHLPQVRTMDTAACTELFSGLIRDDLRSENFILTQPDGDVICSGVTMAAPLNVADRESFARAQSTGKLAISSYVVGTISKRAGLGMAMPVRDERGATVAIIGTLLSVDWLNGMAQQILLPVGGVLTVIDSSGTVIVRQPDPESWIGKSFKSDPLTVAAVSGRAWFEGQSFDGVNRRYAITTVQSVPDPAALFVSIGIDSKIALGPVRDAMYRDLTVLFAAAVLAFVVAWIGATHSVLQPINALLAATKDLGKGKLDSRAELRNGPEELRQLGASFDEMADALQRHDESMVAGRKQIADQEALLRNVLEVLPVGVWLIDAQGNILSGNREGRDIWGGIKHVGIEGYGEIRAWWHDTGKLVEAQEWGVVRALRKGEVSSNEIIDIESFDGVRKVIANWTVPIRDATGQIAGAIGVNQDITQRIRSQAELAASEAQFHALFDNAPDGIVVTDPAGKFVDANASIARMLGYSREELIGLYPQDIVAASDAARVTPEVAELSAGRPYLREWRLRRKDGSTFESEAFATVMPDGRLLSIVRDISERKRAEAARQSLEAQLRQAQKMESLGTLAGGIAHDFNNILGAIIGNVELARQDAGDNAALQTSLAEIRKASNRARELVRQILIFSRQQPQERSVVQLTEIVQESLKLLRATLPAAVELEVSCATDAPNVLADRTQVGQALMNLCTNAWHAMQGEAGRIDIELTDITVGAALGQVDLPSGHYARLSVRDTGQGMDAKTLDRIFDPFFTTKGPGDGTGLGLAVVDGVMKNHEGFIRVASALGSGTTFDLYFPAVASPVVVPVEVASELPRGTRQRILYLDDEEPLVSLATRFLGRLGYEVEGCTQVEDALSKFRAQPARFDLLVTDLNMPATSGLDVAREILTLRPDLPVALASGYVTDALCEQARALGIREVIYKPNTVEEMAQAIHRLLRALA